MAMDFSVTIGTKPPAVTTALSRQFPKPVWMLFQKKSILPEIWIPITVSMYMHGRQENGNRSSTKDAKNSFIWITLFVPSIHCRALFSPHTVPGILMFLMKNSLPSAAGIIRSDIFQPETSTTLTGMRNRRRPQNCWTKQLLF